MQPFLLPVEGLYGSAFDDDYRSSFSSSVSRSGMFADVGVIVTVNLIIDETSGTLTSGKNRIGRVPCLKGNDFIFGVTLLVVVDWRGTWMVTPMQMLSTVNVPSELEN
jgi:hypothetical protein